MLLAGLGTVSARSTSGPRPAGLCLWAKIVLGNMGDFLVGVFLAPTPGLEPRLRERALRLSFLDLRSL